MKKMDIKSFNFPEVLNIPTDKDLLAEAKKRGFYKGSTPYNHLFTDLLFGEYGLKFKEDLNKDFIAKASSYLKTIMYWLEPPLDREKEAICVLLLSELAE